MMFTRVIIVLVVCVGLGSCLTCYHCQHHQPQSCSPLICSKGEVCTIHQGHKGRSTHDNLALPNGCQKASECGLNNCCYDDECVEKVMTTANAPHTTLSVQLTTTSAPVCKDEVVSFMTNCHDLASTGACLESVGVHVCQKTCGFCDYLKSTYGDQGYCRDMLTNNQCATQKVCADSFAVQLCPNTCGLCALKLKNVINEFLNRTTSMASTITMTTTTTTTTTTTPCFDAIENNGCASLPNVCQDGIAHTVCPRFCNLCAVRSMPTTKPTLPTMSALALTKLKATVLATTQSTLSKPTTTTFTSTSAKSSVSQPTSTKPLCDDQLENDGCALLPTGICQEYC